MADADTLVVLLDVDASILEQLLELAVLDAAPDDVTPPLGSVPGWNQERQDWFRRYHRAAAAGLDGPAQEKTWAVLAAGRIAGSVRLKRYGPGALETGIWLGREFRGQGIGGKALLLVAGDARAAGAAVLHAETTQANKAAQALLRTTGARLARDDGGGPVRARLPLH